MFDFLLIELMNFKIEFESLFVLGKWLLLYSYLSLNKFF